jgi:hypothetical protein
MAVLSRPLHRPQPRAQERINRLPCATDIHRAKRSGRASPQCLPNLQLIARHRLPGTESSALHYLWTSAFLRSFINHEPQARSLWPRCDASFPNPAQGLVASSSKGLERKQSRQSLSGGGGVRLLRALCHLPRVVRAEFSFSAECNDCSTFLDVGRTAGAPGCPSR